MARTSRLVLPNFPHHVTLRGNNGRRLFSYPHEYRTFLSLIRRALANGACTVEALALMTNHVHLILTPTTEKALSLFVKAVSQRYAQGRNARRGASGRLFEERYFSVPIVDERQLAITTAYVDLNPVRGGLCADAADYPWSTARLHLGIASRSVVSPALWTSSTWYRALGSDVAMRGLHYREWLDECRARDERPDDRAAVLRELSTNPETRRLERPDRSSAR